MHIIIKDRIYLNYYGLAQIGPSASFPLGTLPGTHVGDVKAYTLAALDFDYYNCNTPV